MDPLCIGSVCIDLSLELGSLIVAVVGAVATYLNHRHHRDNLCQREQHFQEWRGSQRDGRTAVPPEDLLARRA